MAFMRQSGHRLGEIRALPLINKEGGMDLYHKGLQAHYPNLVKKHDAVTLKIIMQSVHDFAYVMTAKLSWHMQNCKLITSSAS